MTMAADLVIRQTLSNWPPSFHLDQYLSNCTCSLKNVSSHKTIWKLMQRVYYFT